MRWWDFMSTSGTTALFWPSSSPPSPRKARRTACAPTPGFVRTPLVDKQIPEQAKELGISEQEVIKNVMLKETADGEFTTVEDVAETALFLASIRSNALTGQSIVVSHGWFMQ
jgi:NAD(P)-dependent dehydrogenase (short-subunit alcohol dehydrogenase family)